MSDGSKQREDGEETSFSRRSYLKLVGTATAPVVASEMTTGAQAATTTTGYGDGGYGDGGYGGTSTESTVAVTTGSAEVAESGATLNGDVTDLGGASSVDAGFEYRVSGTTTWAKTDTETRSATGAFNRSVSGLSSGTDYEFRAVVTASDGDTAAGSIQTFTTTSTANVPTIDQYTVSESGSPNPHAEISVAWQVADADADLRTVAVSITDGSGQQVKTATTDVSGGSGWGTNSFKIKQGGGATYDCTLTVEDSQSQTASQTKTVSA